MPRPIECKEWYHGIRDQTFMVSTNSELLSHDFIQASFASPILYWANPLSPEGLESMLDNSLLLGLYLQSAELDTVGSPPTSGFLENAAPQPLKSSRFTQVGMARLLTDYSTLAYLTDVYVVPEHQGKGLGKWMTQCVKQLTKGMPDLRGTMLMASKAPHAVKFYEQLLGVEVHDQEKDKVVFMRSPSPVFNA